MIDFVDQHTDGPAKGQRDTLGPKIDLAWLRRQVLSLQRQITRNAEQRARFADEPARFIESEADLDAGIKQLSSLSEAPELYGEFVQLGGAASLVGLLAHENTDIAIHAAEIIDELTDDDVLDTKENWDGLVRAFLEGDLLGLLAGNLARLDESEEMDRHGVYYVMAVMENLCSRAETAEAVGDNAALMKWLLDRAQRPEVPVTQNKQYAAEVLALIAHASPDKRKGIIAMDAVDTLLQLAAAYRKRDPVKDGVEPEFMQNIFAALTSLAEDREGKTKFVEAEGVELCIIMLKEGKASKVPSLRLLDYAASGPGGTEVCQRLVDAGGLKPTFTMFMKHDDERTVNHLIALFCSMLEQLPLNTAERIRTLAKFVEKDYEKTAKLVKLCQEYAVRVDAANEAIKLEEQGMDDEQKAEMFNLWFSQRRRAGDNWLQTIAIILAWLVAEDDGAKQKIQSLLADHGKSFAHLRAAIQSQFDEIDSDTKDGEERRNMLSNLMEFLQVTT